MAKTYKTRSINGLTHAYLEPTIAYQIGYQISQVFHCEKILIGKTLDGPFDSTVLSLIHGAKDAGIDIVVAGVSAPALFSYYTEHHHMLGVLLFIDNDEPTLSRLKFYDNGYELFDRQLVTLTQKLTEKVIPKEHKGVVSSVTPLELFETYQRMYQQLDLERINLSIAYTNPHNAPSHYMKEILQSICDEVRMADSLETLKETVISNQCDLGFYFDSFGEKISVFDHSGNLHHGDHILYLIALYYYTHKQLHKNTVVISNMINPGVLRALKDASIKTSRVSHSEADILDKMNQSQYTLAATQEGLIVLNPLRNTSDALLSAVFIMRMIQTSKQTLKSLLEHVKLYPEVHMEYKQVTSEFVQSKMFLEQVKLLQDKTAFDGVFSVFYEEDTHTLMAYLSHCDEKQLMLYKGVFESFMNENINDA